jgi:hypothetical protein
LFVLLDDRSRPDGGPIRILTELAERATLPQEIPTLIEFDLNPRKASLRVLVQGAMAVQPLFFVDECFYLPKYSRVACRFRHKSSCQRSVFDLAVKGRRRVNVRA